MNSDVNVFKVSFNDISTAPKYREVIIKIHWSLCTQEWRFEFDTSCSNSERIKLLNDKLFINPGEYA